MNVDSYPATGIKVNKSLNKSVASIQFAEDRVPSREGKDIKEAQGVRYNYGRRLWEGRDPEQPGANLFDRNRIEAKLASARAED